MVNNYSYLISTIMILTVIVIANVQKNVFFWSIPWWPSHMGMGGIYGCVSIWATVNICCVAPRHQCLQSVLSYFWRFLGIHIHIIHIIYTYYPYIYIYRWCIGFPHIFAHIIHIFLPWNHSFWPIHCSTAKKWMASRPISSAAAVAATSRLRFGCAQQPLVSI